MSSVPDAPAAAREQLLPLLDHLRELAQDEGQAEQERFFTAIRRGIESSRDADDLAGPFMELSTAAFRGFEYSPLVAALLDQVLAVAQTLSATLSAEGEVEH